MPLANVGDFGDLWLSATERLPMLETSDAITHPEEIRSEFDLRIGKTINLKGTARITPAGLICAGIAGVAVLLAATALVRAARR